jgi:acetyltransferase-like isoleucine patch superfamily enzyme
MPTFIADTAKLGPNVELGENVTIEDFCILGAPLRGITKPAPLKIGDGSMIRSHSVIYQGCEFPGGIQTGHHVVIRENTRAGKRFRIGSFSDVEGHCEIGDYVTCHGYVHIGSGSKIGNFVFLYSLVTLTNDPLPPSHRTLARPVVLEDGVVVCVQATVMPGAVMRKGSYAVAGAKIAGEIPAGRVVDAEGGHELHVKAIFDMPTMARLPWMRNHIEKYPEDDRPHLQQLLEEILASASTTAQSSV